MHASLSVRGWVGPSLGPSNTLWALSYKTIIPSLPSSSLLGWVDEMRPIASQNVKRCSSYRPIPKFLTHIRSTPPSSSYYFYYYYCLYNLLPPTTMSSSESSTRPRMVPKIFPLHQSVFCYELSRLDCLLSTNVFQEKTQKA